MGTIPCPKRESQNSPAFVRFAWLAGMGLATLLFALIWLFCDPGYANNDDTYILRVMMGYGSPELPTFNMCLHFILVYPLRWLALAVPGAPWFSWMQLLFLWLAATVSFKSLLQCFFNAGRPLWQGAAACFGFAAAFLFSYCCRVTFTITAAVLGCAAVLQILSIDGARASDGQIIRSMLLALLLATLAYGLRQITLIPILAFCGVALVTLYLRSFARGKRGPRPLVASLLIIALTLGGLAALREAEISQKDMRSYLDWQQARSALVDYHSVTDIPPEILEDAGWTPNQAAMVADWYFMDEAISTESFQKLSAYFEAHTDQSLTARLSRAWNVFTDFFAKEPLAARSLWVTVCVLLLCLTGLLSGKKERLAPAAGLGLGLLGAAALLVYLCLMGRLPLRAMMMVALPFSGLALGLLPSCVAPLPKTAVTQGLIRAAACLLCCLVCCLYAAPALKAQLKPPADPDAEVVNAFQDLDEFALDNEELLLICDSSLISDLRMFPSTRDGIPKNILFWGGWGTRSTEYQAQLESHGFDPDHWQVTDFLNENVRLMRGMIDPPPIKLLNHLNDTTASDCYMESEYGYVYSFAFFEE